MRNFQKCPKSYEDLPKMHKIPGETSKYAQNPTRIFRKCTRSHDLLQIMHTIPRGSSENAQNPMIDFEYCTKSQEELPKCTQSHEEL
jgi:hypothetical protein